MFKLFAHIGKYILLLGSTLSRPEKPSMYLKEVFRQIYEIGIGSLGIVAIISTFMGAVTAVQFGTQLLEIGFIPMWWMGTILRDSMVLELAPTITALLLAGKVGSSISTELGTMRISEQIDALEIMGVNTPTYLILPKIIGALVIMPILIIASCFLGILGGLLAGMLSGFFHPSEFAKGLQDDFDPHYFEIMFIKSIVFAFIITSISCYQGYNVKGGALELGQASTRAVVFSNIVIIIANYIIAQMFL
ncbi:MAG: ABC transporter permease [Chitinophagales bacterium]|nr:ABC transporter permease [Chitinophagales bacterium]